MNGYRPPGMVSGGFAVVLVAIGLLILVPLLVRLPFVLWRPGKGRFAKGFAAAALMLVLCGTALFLAEELTADSPSFRRLLDQAAPWAAGGALLLGAVVGIRAGRRRRPARPTQAPPAEPQPAPAPRGDDPAGGPGSPGSAPG